MLNRRHFLKWGVLLSFMPFPVLSSENDFFRLFAQTVLQGSSYQDHFYKEWKFSFDKSVSYRPAHEQAELERLISALNFAPLRWLLGGPFGNWSKENISQIDLMLNSWNNSRFDLLKHGYSGLISLAQSSWYALDQSWSNIKYLGPPEKWWKS